MQVERLEDTTIPIFFSEYGANVNGRLFHETRAILSSDMTDTFSGGIVYEFFETGNRYGLVKKHEDGSIEKLSDFENLRENVQACAEFKHSTSLEAPVGRETATLKRPEMPPCSHRVSMFSKTICHSPRVFAVIHVIVQRGCSFQT